MSVLLRGIQCQKKKRLDKKENNDMNILEKLRVKLRKWLFQEEIKDIEHIKDGINSAIARYERSNNALIIAKNKYEDSSQSMNQFRNFLESILDVGVDVCYFPQEYSWAVVCIKGKPEYVKFIPFHQHRDAKEVLDFLKQFQYSNKVVDSPIEFKRMLECRIIQNPFE